MDLAIWSTIEPGVGITAASLATLRPLFRSFFSSATYDYAPRSHSRVFSLPRLRSNYMRTGRDVDMRAGEGDYSGAGREAPSRPKSIYVSTTIETTVGPWDRETGPGSSREGSFEGGGDGGGKRTEV